LDNSFRISTIRRRLWTISWLLLHS